MSNNRIKIDEADAATLRHFAEVMLGLEVKTGTNATQIRAKIKQAAPDLDTVPALPSAPPPVVQPGDVAQPQVIEKIVYIDRPAQTAAQEQATERPAAISRPASRELTHASLDPKVKIRIDKTDDKRRAKDVTIGVNGDITQIQRGHWVEVPYRVYLALLNAVEHAAVPDPERINPVTGEPIMVWEPVQSYPFQVDNSTLPTPEQIAAWDDAVGSGFKNVA